MLLDFLIGLGWVVIVIFLVMYSCYCIGLMRVFHRLGQKRWQAIVPLYNFYCLIRVLKLPKKWFVLSLTPYVGTIYSVAVAYRLGRVFKKSLAFSAFWLTLGSPLGMLYIGYSKVELNFKVLDESTPNIKQLEKMLSKNKKVHFNN